MTIENLIHEGCSLFEITDIENLKEEYGIWCSNVNSFFKQRKCSKEKLAELKVNMYYKENEYSQEDTRESIIRALKKSIPFLENSHVDSSEDIPSELALGLIGRLLNNFYLYYRAMYRSPVHKRGMLAQEVLESVKIGNEYDLQRLLYSLLLPLFPTTRLESFNDNKYGGMRADIYLEEYELIIETKCTRGGMTEKRLLEELGADAFLYQAKTIFFFVYDPKEIIKNPEALKRAFLRDMERDGKRIRLFIFQPMEI